MTRTMTKIAALIALFVAAFTSLPARADTTVLRDVSWERTTNYRTTSRWHRDQPQPYYGDDSMSWSFTSAGVWNRTQSDGYQWFYTPDYSSYCGTTTTQYWFRTTVTSPDGGRIVGIRVFDRAKPSTIQLNDGAFLFVNGAEVDGTGVTARTGTSHYDRSHLLMEWEDRPMVAREADLDPTSNEIAILFEEYCVWGGLGRLAIEVITEAADSDGDGVLDPEDACPGFDDALDADSDGVPDGCDLCLGDDASGDDDGDSICSGRDNCPADANPTQSDADADGIGDVCEADTDEDGLIDDLDNCPADFNPSQSDNDGDAAGDACDEDDDNDGVADESDNCALLANADQADFDGDGLGDACDGDDDADGVADEDDLCPGTPLDVPFDGGGCGGEQRVELLCQGPDAHPNHGSYVSCVSHASQQAVQDGLLTSRERAAIVRAAAHS